MLRRFLRSTSGNFNIIFAIALLPLMTAVIGMVDFTSMNRKADKVQNALDTAALEIGVHYYSGMSGEELADIGRHIFLANIVDLQQVDFEYEHKLLPSFLADAEYGEDTDFIHVSSNVGHRAMMGWADRWKATRSSTVRVRAGMPACVLALSPTASPGLRIQGAARVTMEHCVLASNSRASNAVSRDGSSQVKAECVIASGGTSGIVGSGNAKLDCEKPLEYQYPSLAPLAHVVPPNYGDCRGMPNGRNKRLSPGTYCNQTFSGQITLDPGVYILRGGSINLGGNGELVGNGVTIFLMEDARFSITANQTVQLTPPANGPYAGITIFQPRSNKSQVTINGGADSFIEGFIHAPGAHVFHAGNSDTEAKGCLRIIGWTIEMTGTSDVSSDCEAELGGRKIHASRVIAIHH
jgi:hypothetical protein